MASIAPSSGHMEALPLAHDAKSALTPPTSEEWNNKAEGSVSDVLSELDEEEDEVEEEIEPDHYYEGGKIPVFKPTMEQFRSFPSFIQKIDKYGMKSGIVKVIPPKEWRDSLPALDEAVKTIKVKNPITQEFSGIHGTYTQANIEKQRSYNLPQWKALTDEPQHQPPARRGEKRKNTEKASRPAPRVRPPPTAAARAALAMSGPVSGEAVQAKRRPGRPRKNAPPASATLINTKVEASIEDNYPQGPPTPTSPEETPMSTEKPQRKVQSAARVQAKPEEGELPKAKRAKSGGGPSTKTMTISERRKYNRQEKAEQIDEAAFEDFDYRFNAEEFTAERCNELETQYWKSLTFAPPMYGADMPGSLFDDSTTSWNVAKLENLLDVIGQKVPGVNTAYLYLGMWKATFAWHLEDVDLYSINYIHFGAPKQWYSISQEDARRFENAMKTVWPNDAKNCSQFLRHKTYLISPALLKSQYNIEVNKLVHYEGEFVITYPYGYHSGYNLGYNCAESVNFATEQWLEYGKIAKKCDCEADSVWINVEDIERKLRGEPTPEYDEITDDEGDVQETITDLPSPPASVAGKPKPIRKRKRDSTAALVQQQPKAKKIRLRIRTTAFFEPCVLCPNNLPSEPLLPTDTGKHAHRVCALYTPETYFTEEKGAEMILGIADIDKARMDLKCSFCRSTKGACFQCSSRKCIRAYHATCAAPGGVLVDYGPTPVYGEDGTEYISEGYDFRCKFHRPKRPKNITLEALETSSLIKKYARALRPKDVVQAQYLLGDVFAGTVVENRPHERAVVISVLPDGDQVEVEWKWLTVLDPAESQLPRPTQDAKPLPAHMNVNQEFGPPIPGDHFLDPASLHKWAEFNTAPAPHNAAQVKINLEKVNQLWYYLGLPSTEAKPQYTEDPANPRHNPAGSFLDSVKPVPQPQAPVQRKAPPATHSTVVNYHAQNAAMVQARQQSVIQADFQARPYQYKPKWGFSTGSEINPQSTPNGMQYSTLPQASSVPHNWKQPAMIHSASDPSANLGTPQRAGSWADIDSVQQAYKTQMLGPAVHPSPLTFSQDMFDFGGAQFSPYGSSLGEQRFAHTPQFWMQPVPQANMPRPAPMANMGASAANMSVTPRTIMATKESVEIGKEHEFLKRIQPYKYLLNSYCRRPKVYVSPYTRDGGFSDEYIKIIAQPEPTALDLPHYQECALPLISRPQSSFKKPNEPAMPLPRRLYQQVHQPRSIYAQHQTPQQFEQQVREETNGGQMTGTTYDKLMRQIAASVQPSGT